MTPYNLSHCCGAKIIHTDICSECGEHTEAEPELEREEKEELMKIKKGNEDQKYST